MGDVVGTMTLQLSRWNTSRSKEFTFNLQVLNDKAVIWNERVGAVLPNHSDQWWAIETEESINQVGPEVATALSTYADIAMTAVMEDPHPMKVPDDVRSFIQPDPDYGRSIDETLQERALADQMRRDAQSWSREDCIAHLSDERFGVLARGQLLRHWPDDPLTLTSFIAALSTESAPEVRAGIARMLGFWPTAAPVERPLREAVNRDEDARVRWAARYALAIRRNGLVPPPNPDAAP
jgi:hypothetical protein